VSLRVVRLGSPRVRGEGLRLGTVRRPPRGVARRDWAKGDWFDVWLPELAPSAATIALLQRDRGARAWERFARRYRSEMRAPERQRLLTLLARLSHATSFSVGCYCEDEQRCHRSLLRALLEEHGARFA
jgi:uncharacterized protein YeaO (DUF488 family)